jgi:hypothetical protein
MGRSDESMRQPPQQFFYCFQQVRRHTHPETLIADGFKWNARMPTERLRQVS